MKCLGMVLFSLSIVYSLSPLNFETRPLALRNFLNDFYENFCMYFLSGTPSLWLLDLQTDSLTVYIVLFFSISFSFCFTFWKIFFNLDSLPPIEFLFLYSLSESYKSSVLNCPVLNWLFCIYGSPSCLIEAILILMCIYITYI